MSELTFIRLSLKCLKWFFASFSSLAWNYNSFIGLLMTCFYIIFTINPWCVFISVTCNVTQCAEKAEVIPLTCSTSHTQRNYWLYFFYISVCTFNVNFPQYCTPISTLNAFIIVGNYGTFSLSPFCFIKLEIHVIYSVYFHGGIIIPTCSWYNSS